MDQVYGYERAVKVAAKLAKRWNEPVNVCRESYYPGGKSLFGLYTDAAMDREGIGFAQAICYPDGELEEG